MNNLEKSVIEQVNKSIGEAIGQELVGYNKPLSQLVSSVVDDHREQLRMIIDSNITELLENTEFRTTIKTELNNKLAKVLVSRFGGELESQINKLKADPTTRAKITVAINQVIESM